MNLGELTGDSVQDLYKVYSENAEVLAAEGQSFIEGLKANANVDFQIGDIPAVGFTNLTFESELAIAANTRVVKPDFGLFAIDNKIAQLSALVAPTPPSLDRPSVNVPDLASVSPIITLPTRPDADVGPAPSDAPSIQDVQPPEAPALILPNLPTFDELQIPVAPSYSLPTFSGAAPQNLLTPPTNNFSYVDSGYTSSLRDPLVAKLLDNLINGGYGIDSTDEQALWARARDRAEQQGKVAMEEAGKTAVATSFPMPQGALFASLDRAKQKLQESLSDINREIALKRADLYVENRKFTIQEVQKYEEIAIGLYNAVQERSLNFAKETANLAILYYDAAVKNFNASLDAYKTEAQVFEALVRAELSKAELYKAQVEAEKLRAEFNQTKVNLYVAQLQGVAQVVNLYKTRVEAANLLATLQQQKLEVFKSRVAIFSTRVAAKQAEFEMYKAGVQGELARVEIYKAEVDAFAQRVTAEETKSRIVLQSNQALLQQYDAAVKQYSAQMEGFKQAVTSAIDKAKVQVSAYDIDTNVYRAFVSTLQEGARVRVFNQQMNNNWNTAALNSQVEQVKFRLEQLKLTVGNMNDINYKGAEFFRTALGATLSSLNALTVKTAE